MSCAPVNQRKEIRTENTLIEYSAIDLISELFIASPYNLSCIPFCIYSYGPYYISSCRRCLTLMMSSMSGSLKTQRVTQRTRAPQIRVSCDYFWQIDISNVTSIQSKFYSVYLTLGLGRENGIFPGLGYKEILNMLELSSCEHCWTKHRGDIY